MVIWYFGILDAINYDYRSIVVIGLQKGTSLPDLIGPRGNLDSRNLKVEAGLGSVLDYVTLLLGRG